MGRLFLILCALSVTAASCTSDFDGSTLKGKWVLTEAQTVDNNGNWTNVSSGEIAIPQYWLFDDDTFVTSGSDFDTIPANAAITPYEIIDSVKILKIMDINASYIIKLNKKELVLTTEDIVNEDGTSFEPLRTTFKRLR